MTSAISAAPVLDDRRRRRLEPVGYRSCVQLLAGRRLGRVIYTSGAMPAAQPVAYGIDADEVVFSTDRGSVLDHAVTGAVVAFEVDDIDLEAQDGWSVLVVGQAYRVTDPDRLAALGRRLPRSVWNGPLTTTIAIPLTQLTGRRLATAAVPA